VSPSLPLEIFWPLPDWQSGPFTGLFFCRSAQGGDHPGSPEPFGKRDKCRGSNLQWGFIIAFVRVTCPNCKAVQWFNTSCVATPDFIVWNDRKKEFIVQVKMCCFKDNYQFLADIKRIPVELEIASGERCPCGGDLLISNFSFKPVNDDIVFDGNFFCNRCYNETHPQFQPIKSGLIAIWKNTRTIKIVPSGIKYKKMV